MEAPDHSLTYLFVPGNRPERFGKALATGAVPILDLEDAVSPTERPAARQCLAESGPLLERCLVRINARSTEDFDKDIALLSPLRIYGVVLAKTESAEDIQAVRSALGGKTRILALIETAAGIAAARDIARSGVSRLAFGTVDFCADLGIRDDGEPLASFRSELGLASRLGGLPPPVDGVCTAINDDELLRSHTRRAAAFGFGGILCIHPRQVPIIEEVFAPTPAEVERAQKIMAAAEAHGSGVIAVDGTMVDRPVIALAERTLALHCRLQRMMNP